ncbi:MAG: hypothetical protein B6U89_00690 [Desulfurococcales archaeon ex4484_58]|nr:MAG: hypothetical protein B6U89_00690 [Desulfurococcales archaeon ex4484_58]
MNPIIHLISIPLFQFLLLEINKIKKTRIIRYVPPIIYAMYVAYLSISRFGRITGYSLSTIPMMGDIQLSIIFILDDITLIYLILISIIYMFLTLNNTIIKNHEILITLSIITLLSSSLDLILNFITTLSILIIFSMEKKTYIYVATFFTALNILGYLISNTINVGLIVHYYIYNTVSKPLLGYGVYLYVLAYFLLLSVSIEMYPILRGRRKLDEYDFLLTIVSSMILLRLLPSLMLLYYDSFFYVFKYSILALSILNLLHYSLKILEKNTMYLKNYELGYIPLTLILTTPYAFIALNLLITTYLIHIFIERIHGSVWIDLSRIGLPPTPGFIPRFLIILLILLKLGVLPFMLVILTMTYTVIGFHLNIRYKMLFNDYLLYIMIFLSLILILLVKEYSGIFSLLFNLKVYRNIVYGV